MLEAQAEYVIRTPGGPVLLNGEQSTYGVAITALDPVAWYRMGEGSGTTMVDGAGSYPGTYVNGPALTRPSTLPEPAASNAATRFDGTNDYATIPYAAALDTTEWTWQMWITPEGLATAGSLVKTIMRDASVAYLHAYIQNERLYVSLNPAGTPTVLDGGEILEDFTYQVALAVSGNIATLYKNGEIADEAPYAWSPRGSGAWEFARGASGTNYYFGRIDDLAYFDTYLTLADITRLYAIPTDPQAAYLYMTESPLRDLPIRSTQDSYPLADGGVIGDQYADPAHWTLNGVLKAASAAALQTDAQRWRGRLNSLIRGAGLLMWQPSGFPPLQSEIRRGEQPEAGRGTPSSKPLIASLVSADPRVYSQQIVATSVETADLDGGITSPFVGPIVEAAPDPADAATITNDGDAYTPPVIELAGPFGSATITRTHTEDGTTTVQAIVVDETIDDGVTLTIDTSTGRVYTGTEYSSTSNAYDALEDGSVLWALGPGENTVTCQMAGIGSATSCIIKHRHAWLA